MSYCENCNALIRQISAGSSTFPESETHHSAINTLFRSALSCIFCNFILNGTFGGPLKHTYGVTPHQYESTLGEKLATQRNDADEITYHWTVENGDSRGYLNVGCRWYVHLSAYAEIDTQAAASGRLPTTPSVIRTISNAATRVKSWMQTCSSGHSACREAVSGEFLADEQPLPKRILDTWCSNDPESIKLVLGNGIVAPYCTLSHCWGPPDKRPLRTTMSNLDEHLRGIKFCRLPKTFQEAVTLTRSIGIRYLWIDSLCIVQDDEQEWNAESNKMGGIYSKSLLTIAASGARHSGEGLFISRHATLEPLEVPFHTSQTSQVTNGRFFLYERFYYPPSSSPLSTRGWVVQEWRLSRRVVHFTRSGLFWRCEALKEDEREDFEEFEQWESWDSLLHNYSLTNFTYETDRLVALQGLAAEMGKKRADKYHFGHWSADFPNTLTWRMRSADDDSHPGVLDAPSWSWPSRIGGKFFSGDLIDMVDDAMKLEEEDFEVASSGVMRISGPNIIECTLSPLDEDEQEADLPLSDMSAYLGYSATHLMDSISGVARLAQVLGVGLLDDLNRIATHCLLLGREKLEDRPQVVDWVLLMQEKEDATGHPCFERVGVGLLHAHRAYEGWKQLPAINIV